LLTEAALLIVSGLILGDRPIRIIGGASMAVAVAHSAAAVLDPLAAKILAAEGIGSERAAAGATAVAALVALACLASREVLRARGYTAASIEQGYTWMAFGLVALALAHEVPFAFWALAATLLALVLLEAGLLRAAVYRYQAYAAGGFAILWIIGRYFLATGVNVFDFRVQPASPHADVVLSVSAALAFAMLYRLRRVRIDPPPPDLQAGVGIAGLIGATALTLLPWYVLNPVSVAPAWAAIALGSVALGARLFSSGARWLGYVLILMASLRSLVPLVQRAPESMPETIAAAVIIAALYAIGYLGRRAASDDVATRDGVEWQLATGLGFVATAAFAVFKWRVLPPIAVAPGWAATAVVLVILGVIRGQTGQRWQGYLLAVVAGVGAFDWMDRSLSSTFEYWSPLSVCLAGYLIAAIGRGVVPLRGSAVGGAGAPDAAETSALRFIPMGATLLLVLIEADIVHPDHVALAWALSAAVFMVVGLLRAAADLRWQAYALLLAAVARTAGLILPIENMGLQAIASAGAVIALAYGLAVAGRMARPTSGQGMEDAVRLATIVAATLVLTVLIANEANTRFVTLGWGLEGLALMAGGFMTRERVLRLSGLGVLLLCILKLFVVDLRELEPLARILSFVVLGLVLLAVSWTYTRYQEQIRRFL
jgi:hypothetical protein